MDNGYYTTTSTTVFQMNTTSNSSSYHFHQQCWWCCVPGRLWRCSIPHSFTQAKDVRLYYVSRMPQWYQTWYCFFIEFCNKLKAKIACSFRNATHQIPTGHRLYLRWCAISNLHNHILSQQVGIKCTQRLLILATEVGFESLKMQGRRSPRVAYAPMGNDETWSLLLKKKEEHD